MPQQHSSQSPFNDDDADADNNASDADNNDADAENNNDSDADYNDADAGNNDSDADNNDADADDDDVEDYINFPSSPSSQFHLRQSLQEPQEPCNSKCWCAETQHILQFWSCSILCIPAQGKQHGKYWYRRHDICQTFYTSRFPKNLKTTTKRIIRDISEKKTLKYGILLSRVEMILH